MSSVQVFFTTTPQEITNYRDPVALRESLMELSFESCGIQFVDFEHPEKRKVLRATIANMLCLWTLQDNVWDFHGFRNPSIDFSQAVISWRMFCSLQVGSDTHQILYSSTQTFADFEQAILSYVLAEALASPVIEVKLKTTKSGSFSTALFTEELFKQRIVRNQPIDLLVRSEHASYSQLKARYVLPKFEYTPSMDPHMESENGPAEISAKFKTLTGTPDPDFDMRVRDFAEIMLRMNKDTPFGLFIGFEFLRFVRSSFPDSPGTIDWNETQRRTICDPLMYTLATILSRKVHEEIDVWPQKPIPKEAMGHGPLDYYLPGLAAILGHKTRKRNREDEELHEDDDDDEDEHEENPFGGDIMSEKKTSSSVESSLAQVLAQALDTMREGSLPDLDRDDTPKGNRRFCVLSTGQRYYFFRIDWDGTTKPHVTYLGLYRFRYFPPRFGTSSTSTNRSSKRSSSDLEASDTFSVHGYVDVLAAFFACILDGGNEANLRSLLLEASERFKAFKSSDPVSYYYNTLEGKEIPKA